MPRRSRRSSPRDDRRASDDDPTWRLVDRIAALRDVDPESIDLAVDWLDALLRHRGGSPGVTATAGDPAPPGLE